MALYVYCIVALYVHCIAALYVYCIVALYVYCVVALYVYCIVALYVLTWSTWDWSLSAQDLVPLHCSTIISPTKFRYVALKQTQIKVRYRTHTLSLPRAIKFKFLLQYHQKLLPHTAWRTWLFIADSDERCLYHQFSLPYFYIRFSDCRRLW